MDLRRFVRHLEFPSESGNHCSDMQRLALKLKVNTSSINLNLQEAITRIPCFRRPVFIKHLFLVCGVDSTSKDVAANFSSLYISKKKVPTYHNQFFPAASWNILKMEAVSSCETSAANYQ